MLEGETIPHSEKLFSVFETHSQLYKRGKAGEPLQFGRLALVFEDGAGFITHYHLLSRDQGDRDVVVEQTRIAQQRHRGKIRRVIAAGSLAAALKKAAAELDAASEILALDKIGPRLVRLLAQKTKRHG